MHTCDDLLRPGSHFLVQHERLTLTTDGFITNRDGQDWDVVLIEFPLLNFSLNTPTPETEVNSRVGIRGSAAPLGKENPERNDILLSDALLCLAEDLKVVAVLQDGQDKRHAPAHILLSNRWALEMAHLPITHLEGLRLSESENEFIGDRLNDVALAHHDVILQ